MLLLVALVIGQGVLASVQKAIFKKNPRELFCKSCRIFGKRDTRSLLMIDSIKDFTTTPRVLFRLDI
jgi:hypothetical protein